MPFRRLSLLLALAAAWGIVPARAQQAPTQVPSPAEVIPRLLDEAAVAWNQADLDGYLALYADSVRFMTPQGPATGRQRMRELLEQHVFRAGQPVPQIRFDRVEVATLGPAHALVTGRTVLTSSGGMQIAWFSTVWAWNGTRWEAIHNHST
jgi:uncharacterized protein (TIGR02246 family)